MSDIKDYLLGLPEETKSLFEPYFDSIERFYTVVYLIVRNEHVTDMEKPDRYEDRLAVIRRVKEKIEQIVTGFGLDGGEIITDITSDYFEDYVNYDEPAPDITDEEFISIIKKITA